MNAKTNRYPNPTTPITSMRISTTRVFNTPTKVLNVVNAYTGFTGPVRSMGFLAAKYNTTTATIRRVLVANGVAIRGRGRVAQSA